MLCSELKPARVEVGNVTAKKGLEIPTKTNSILIECIQTLEKNNLFDRFNNSFWFGEQQ